MKKRRLALTTSQHYGGDIKKEKKKAYLRGRVKFECYNKALRKMNPNIYLISCIEFK
jgi:hypothetical protein